MPNSPPMTAEQRLEAVKAVLLVGGLLRCAKYGGPAVSNPPGHLKTIVEGFITKLKSTQAEIRSLKADIEKSSENLDEICKTQKCFNDSLKDLATEVHDLALITKAVSDVLRYRAELHD